MNFDLTGTKGPILLEQEEKKTHQPEEINKEMRTRSQRRNVDERSPNLNDTIHGQQVENEDKENEKGNRLPAPSTPQVQLIGGITGQSSTQSVITNRTPHVGYVEDSNKKNTPPPSVPVKKKRQRRGKGRRKIEIKFIEQKSRRQITFSKRKSGLMKKAFELSTLTGSEIIVLVTSESGHVYTFATQKFQPMITMQEGKNLIQAMLSTSYTNEGEDESEFNAPTSNRRLQGLGQQVGDPQNVVNPMEMNLRNRIYDFQNSMDVKQQQQQQHAQQQIYSQMPPQMQYRTHPPPRHQQQTQQEQQQQQYAMYYAQHAPQQANTGASVPSHHHHGHPHPQHQQQYSGQMSTASPIPSLARSLETQQQVQAQLQQAQQAQQQQHGQAQPQLQIPPPPTSLQQAQQLSQQQQSGQMESGEGSEN